MKKYLRIKTLSTLCLAALASTPLDASAQPGGQQATRPPVAQYWMDVANHTVIVPGAEAMQDEAAAASAAEPDEDTPPPSLALPGLGGLIPGMPGLPVAKPTAPAPPRMPAMFQTPTNNVFGNTLNTPGRWVDIALFTQKQPAGSEASQTIPAGMKLGPSLALLPSVRETPQPTNSASADTNRFERPKGRVLFYWGCSAAVQPGQPRVLDFSQGDPKAWSTFVQGRTVRDAGARDLPGHLLWPNRKDSRPLPAGASLVGEHVVRGSGVPESLKFTLSQAQDFMAPIALTQRGDLQGSLALGWQPVQHAQAYFLSAMGGSDDEVVIWSSSEQPEPGFGLMDYASGANIARWLAEKVLLGPGTTSCAIPKGIFGRSQGASLRMIAYGPELTVVYPPQPTSPKPPWNQAWTLRVRNKSTATTFLGQP